MVAQTGEGMRRLGVVENIVYDGSVLVRAAFAPQRGASVLDGRKRPLGRVARVFGPVAEPFVAVRPEAKAAVSLIGADVYLDEVGYAGKKDRRGRGSH